MKIDLALLRKHLQPYAGEIVPGPTLNALKQAIQWVMQTCAPVYAEDLPYPIQFRNNNIVQAFDVMAEYFPEMQAPLSKVGKTEYSFSCVREFIEKMLAEYSLSSKAILHATIAPRWAINFQFQKRQGAVIKVTDALDALLCASDIDADIPMRLLALPYSSQYVCIGKYTAQQMAMHPSICGKMYPEGVFCVRSATPQGDCLTLFNRWIANDKSMDSCDYVQHLIADPDQSLKQWLESIPKSLPNKQFTTEDISTSLEFLTYIAKLFLYLGMKDARVARQQEHSELTARLQRVAEKKRDKLARRLERTYDAIVVGPEQLPQALQTGEEGEWQEVSPHWRRGHFRLQPHGKGNSLRKLIFVQPVLVGSHQLTETQSQALAPKNYRIAA